MTAVEHEAFVTYDRSFAVVLGPTPSLVKVADVDAHEGPVWIDGSLHFTTVPAPKVSIKRLELHGLEAKQLFQHLVVVSRHFDVVLFHDTAFLSCPQNADVASFDYIEESSRLKGYRIAH